MLAGLHHPQRRPPDEKRRRHQPMRRAGNQRCQVESDQSHVVGQRHPRQRRIVRRGTADAGEDGVDVGDQVAMRQHDALGRAGRAGRKLDEGDVVGTGWLRRSRRAQVGDFVDEHAVPLQPRECCVEAVLAREGGEPLEGLALGGDVRLSERRQHAKELALVLVGVAGGKRHRDDAAHDARPERIDERLERVDQQDHLGAGPRAAGLEMTQKSERPGMQLGVADAMFARLADDVVDPVGRLPARRQRMLQRGEGGHGCARSAGTIIIGCRGRRLTCGSSSIVWPGASVSRNRRASITT